MRWFRALACFALAPLMAHAQDWPYSSYTDSDHRCSNRICRYYWADPEAARRCSDRYSEMVSEQLANPYHKAQPDPSDESCPTAGSDPCIDAESVAIGRLVGIYTGL